MKREPWKINKQVRLIIIARREGGRETSGQILPLLAFICDPKGGTVKLRVLSTLKRTTQHSQLDKKKTRAQKGLFFFFFLKEFLPIAHYENYTLSRVKK